ncbi:LysR substrate-binding domain-containing protein [Marinobacterium lacunae]|nr:LysR substrate-binding domain-containing protein [Marinobacterium lacunae]MBR9885548.1 LysR family transcriptional regulator [Oceanospirillales bacterium]
MKQPRDKLQKVTLRQLQIFLVAAETLSFQRAAESLGLTPPAVSMQMGSLGEELGSPLFEKKGRSIELTPAGEKLVPYARRITQTLREANNAIQEMLGRERRTVKVAMVSTSRNFGPHLVAQFQARHPEAKLDIQIANRSDVIDLLESEAVDLALMGRTPRRIEVEATSFAKHPYVIIASPKHPLAEAENIDPKQLLSETFLARESGSGTRMVLEHFFEDRGLDLPPIQEMSGNENIKQAVMANMGLAVISQHTLQLELMTGRLKELKVQGMPDIRQWFVVRMIGKELSSAATQFQEFVTTEGPSFMADFFSLH